MVDLCSACLCSGRKLVIISGTELFHVYSQILNEIPVYGDHIIIQVCWECRHLLGKFQQFKDQVKNSYMQLLQCVHEGLQDIKHFARLPHLQPFHNVVSIDYPSIKLEFDSLYLNSDQIGQNFEDLHQYDQTVGQPFSQSYDRISQSCGRFSEDDDGEYLNDVKEEGCRDSTAVDVEEEKIEQKEDDKLDETQEEELTKIREPKLKTKKSKSKRKKSVPKIKVKKKRKKLKKAIKMDEEDLCGVGNDDFSFDTPLKEDEGRAVEKIERDDDIEYGKSDLQETDNFDELPQISLSSGPALKKREPRTKLVTSEKPQCAECGKVFSSRKTLRYHLNVLHKGNNRYPCPQCGKVYQWKSNLGRHIRSHKAREKGELYCETCDKWFASVATYRQHLAVSKQHVSESEFKFTCDECGKKFVNKTRLRDHIDWEHLQKIKFRCQLCNKPFKCHTSLYVHMNNVHTNKGLKDNLCHVCGKSYQNRAKLRYHIVAMHTSETPYQCEQCSAAFGWYSSLYRHVREVHYKMKIHPSKSKRSKKKLEVLPPMGPPTHLGLPLIPQIPPQETVHL